MHLRNERLEPHPLRLDRAKPCGQSIAPSGELLAALEHRFPGALIATAKFRQGEQVGLDRP
jgi:hypothetical protein